MAIGSTTFMHSISFSYFDFSIRQASLSSPSAFRIRHRFPSGRRLNFQHPSASQRFGYFSSRCSITNTDVQLDHVRSAEAHVESSTVEPDCLVPIVKLNSDVLETEPLNLLTEATYVNCLLTALPVLSEEEQQAISASPCPPSWIIWAQKLLDVFPTFYACCVAGNLVEQLWNFAWPSAIALIQPSLLPVAMMGFFLKVAIIVGGPLVGKVMDHVPRVSAYNCLNIIQAAAQLLSTTMIIHAHSVCPTSMCSLLLRAWFVILVSAGAIERLCGVALGVANERDWVVLLAGVNRPLALAQANAVLNRLDLLCEITGASLFGYLLSKFDPVICLKFSAGLMMGLLPVTSFLAWLANKLSAGVLDRPKSSQSHCKRFTEETEPDVDNIAGLHPSIIGGFSGLCAFMGVAATFVSSTLVKHLGILKAGAAGLVFQALLLCMAVAVYWSGSIS